MFSQVKQALESLSAALGGLDTAPTQELRDALGLAKSLRTKAEFLETRAASLVAQRERHGDGGAGLLNQVGGLSRSEAARNVRVASELASLPEAQSAVAEGEISLANAAKLAQAARKTSPQAVQDDAGLVEMAKALPTDEFAQAAQRWTIRHQSAADLEEQHRRNRRNRSVRFWNGEDGTVQMRGAFDAEMGARIQTRLRGMAEQLRRADRRTLRDGECRGAVGGRASGTAETGVSGSAGDDGGEAAAEPVEAVVRTRDQRMADALDRLLAGDAPSAEAHTMASAAAQSAAASSGERETAEQPFATGDSIDVGPRRTVTEIIVRADLDALLGRPGGTAEIPGAGPIPLSALDRLLCGSDLSLVLCGADFTPLFEAVASRAPTAAQRRALIARDGACIGCGEPPGECEAHHIVPWKKGGKTRVDNLVLVCWSCHDRIHDHNWRVVVRNGRFRLAPPDPAHPHNPARSRKPARTTPARGSRRAPASRSQVPGRDDAMIRDRVGAEGAASRASPTHDLDGPARGDEHNVDRLRDDRPRDDGSSPGHEQHDLFAVA